MKVVYFDLPKTKEQVEALFYPMLRDSQRIIPVWKICQASPVYPSGKNA
jgi:hypothetical protein